MGGRPAHRIIATSNFNPDPHSHMASHLDLEEQEQLEQLKAFWKRWGNPITWLLTLALVAYAGWTGWN